VQLRDGVSHRLDLETQVSRRIGLEIRYLGLFRAVLLLELLHGSGQQIGRAHV
jgi:hypothetical protein